MFEGRQRALNGLIDNRARLVLVSLPMFLTRRERSLATSNVIDLGEAERWHGLFAPSRESVVVLPA